MTTNNKIVKKLTRSAALNAARNNVRRRVARAEKRCEITRAAAVAANKAADEARDKVLGLLGELKLQMKAVGTAKTRKSKGEVSQVCFEEMSMPLSTLAANKVAKFLSSTSTIDAIENAPSAS